MPPSGTQFLKSKFSQWVLNNAPNINHTKFNSSLDNVLHTHLPNSDQNTQFMIRDFLYSDGIDYRYIDPEMQVFPYNSSLFVATIMPSWDKGLRTYCNDESVYNVISLFFHYSSQYVIRSRFINVMGALCITTQRACDFRGMKIASGVIEKQDDYRDTLKSQIKGFLETDLTEETYTDEKSKSVTELIQRINALDPYINRGLFQFITAIRLYENGFMEESVTSLDKAVDVVHQYAKTHMGLVHHNYLEHRDAILGHFGFSDETLETMKLLYNARNFFGGHPSMSKWWDFTDLFEFKISDFIDSVSELLCKLILHEEANRVVVKNPSSWSQWFNDNTEIIWDAAWFEKLDKHLY